MKLIFTIFTILFLATSAFSSGDHGEGENNPSERVGPGKAVEAFDKEEGFKLSEKATKNLGIQFSAITGSGPWKIPKESLVRIKQSIGIYRKYEGWISFVLVKVIREENASAFILSEDLETNDEVAIKGAHYLRMTDSDLNAGTVDSCAH
jgi:hypothetical protein